MKSPEQTPNVEQTCPNCGTIAPLEMALCPRCGMQLHAPARAMYGCLSWIFQGTLALLALVFGASGACFTFFGVFGSNQVWLLLTGAVLLVLTYGCIWAVFRIGRSRK